jgi:hypothetical protein
MSQKTAVKRKSMAPAGLEESAPKDTRLSVPTPTRRTIYDKWIGQWNEDEKADSHTLLYFGAGWDMAFPLHKLNVLIDREEPSWARFGSKTFIRDLIHRQLEVIFPDDLQFAETPAPVNTWRWWSQSRDVMILYYHSWEYCRSPSDPEVNKHLSKEEIKERDKQYREQKLPAEAYRADILHISGFHPDGVLAHLPQLKYLTHGYNTVEWDPVHPTSGPGWESARLEARFSHIPKPKLPESGPRYEYLHTVYVYLRALCQTKSNLNNWADEDDDADGDTKTTDKLADIGLPIEEIVEKAF